MRTTRLRCEPLEARTTPAGFVHASMPGSVLTLAGDDLDNIVELKQSGGSIEVIGLGGTKITGATSFAGITGIQAFLFDGDDSIVTTADLDFILPGKVSADLGDG